MSYKHIIETDYRITPTPVNAEGWAKRVAERLGFGDNREVLDELQVNFQWAINQAYSRGGQEMLSFTMEMLDKHINLADEDQSAAAASIKSDIEWELSQ